MTEEQQQRENTARLHHSLHWRVTVWSRPVIFTDSMWIQTWQQKSSVSGVCGIKLFTLKTILTFHASLPTLLPFFRGECANISSFSFCPRSPAVLNTDLSRRKHPSSFLSPLNWKRFCKLLYVYSICWHVLSCSFSSSYPRHKLPLQNSLAV